VRVAPEGLSGRRGRGKALVEGVHAPAEDRVFLDECPRLSPKAESFPDRDVPEGQTPEEVIAQFAGQKERTQGRGEGQDHRFFSHDKRVENDGERQRQKARARQGENEGKASQGQDKDKKRAFQRPLFLTPPPKKGNGKKDEKERRQVVR